MGKVAVVSLLAAILITIYVFVIVDYQINRDITAWKDRAQVSSEPNDMLLYMSNVKDGMVSWGMTTGHAALVFKTPENDMSLIMRTVEQHIEQAQVLTTMDRTTPEYQTGLDNLRGSIRELELHAYDYWGVNQGFLSWIICLALWITTIFTGVKWIGQD